MVSKRAQKDLDERAEIERKRAELRAVADKRHDEQGPPVGCGDSSCVVESPRGMATNGRCRCTDIEIRIALKWYRYEYERRYRNAYPNA